MTRILQTENLEAKELAAVSAAGTGENDEAAIYAVPGGPARVDLAPTAHTAPAHSIIIVIANHTRTES